MAAQKHILVVDHVGAVHDTIRAMLEQRGYQVDTVSDAVVFGFLPCQSEFLPVSAY